MLDSFILLFIFSRVVQKEFPATIFVWIRKYFITATWETGQKSLMCIFFFYFRWTDESLGILEIPLKQRQELLTFS